LQRVFSYVKEGAPRFIEELRTLIRQPSISAQGIGIRECAMLLREMMEKCGISAQIHQTERNPILLGEVRLERADRTLLLTAHYDVQPPDPIDKWNSPPFEARLKNGRIVGRGATDCKGNLMAILKAVESMLQTLGDVPVNLKFLFDGEEEIGSPSLPGFIEKNRDLLKVDSVVTLDAGFDPSGRPFVWLGNSGLLSVDITSQGAKWDLHSSRARLVMNPAWRLIWALSTIKDRDENVLIEGFCDQAKPPSVEESKLLDEFPWNDQEQKDALGIDNFLLGVGGRNALERLLFQPTCSVTGITSGYSGAGQKAVLPSRAQAKLEFRLVPFQDPDDILRKLRNHLAANGFGDLTVSVIAKTEPATTSLSSKVSRAAIKAASDVYGLAPVVKPRHEGSGRQGTWIASRLRVDGLLTGVGPPRWQGHAPNEFITVEHYLNGIRYVASIIHEYGR